MLMAQGQMVKINDVIDADTAELIATELGHTVKRVSEADVEEGLYDIPADDKAEDLTDRAPVVTIMGHVDHGKTSLLDAIRETNVVSGEAGGITQHIGAYQVEKNGQKITFLDTPGHEAFTAMRARGAQATDIAVLVVAADDGVMPQTIESIKHAKAAGVPIIVAINKMDKPDANPTRVRTELLQHEVFVESMGGDVLDVEVSAVTKAGLDKLLETILLQAEVLELKVARDGRAEGLVIEAKLDRGRGAVATVLVQRGTLAIGDILVAGTEFARVRALINDKGEQVKEAGPSIPVEVLGFTGVPSAGDRFSVVETEARAREVTDYRQRLDPRKDGGRRRHQPRADDESAQGLGHRQVPADHQGRRAGLGRSDQRLAQQALDRRSLGADPDERRRRHHRIRRDAGDGIERHHHRLQRPRQQAGLGPCDPRRHRDPLLQHHLRPRG